jgi:cell division protein FtsI (penicillin-binding protein 3)
MINEPKKHHYGGTVAAPAFKKIAIETLNYLNITPDKGKHNLTAAFQEEVNG